MVYAPSGFPVDTAGTAPEATTFAIRDGKVVIEFDVNGDPGSNVVGTPKAWAPSPFEVVLRLEMATFQYHRVEISRYKLIGSDRMSYMTNAHVYDVHSGDLVASERRKANFKKLEGETGELWNKARAKWEAQHHTVDLGSFESPTEKGSQ
jgi:hypothetical protein